MIWHRAKGVNRFGYPIDCVPDLEQVRSDYDYAIEGKMDEYYINHNIKAINLKRVRDYISYLEDELENSIFMNHLADEHCDCMVCVEDDV